MGFIAFLGSPLGRIAGYGLIALVLAGTLLGVKHEWDSGQAALKTVHQAAAVQHAQVKAVATVDKAAATSEVSAQTKIVTRTRTLLQKVPVYVTASTPCIPWSVVRLHDAAVLHVDPDSLKPPAGQADDACSDVPPLAFVDTVISNYGAGDANAEQLNALEADIAARQKGVDAASVVAPAAAVK